MQTMAAYNKEWIQNQKIENTDITHKLSDTAYAHEVTLLPGKLKDILNKDKIMVSSMHSYMVPDSGIHNISAIAPDGVIEAIENPNCDFNIGLQWHPELMGDDENSKLIFNALLESAEEYSYRKRV